MSYLSGNMFQQQPSFGTPNYFQQSMNAGGTQLYDPSMMGSSQWQTTAPQQGGFLSRNGSNIMGGLNALNGLWGAYNGMQQTKLAKQQMATSIAQWNQNYGNQVKSYNTQLEDRARARYNANPNNPTVDSYMDKNRLK